MYVYMFLGGQRFFSSSPFWWESASPAPFVIPIRADMIDSCVFRPSVDDSIECKSIRKKLPINGGLKQNIVSTRQ